MVSGVPYTYRGIGGADPALYPGAEDAGRAAQDVPVNNSSCFAPVIQPTFTAGTKALAVLEWLSR